MTERNPLHPDRVDWHGELIKRFPITCSNIYCGASVPDAWEPIVEEALEKLEALAAAGSDIRVAQIKEKFNGLRLYYDGGWDYPEGTILERVATDAIVDAAEAKVWALA